MGLLNFVANCDSFNFNLDGEFLDTDEKGTFTHFGGMYYSEDYFNGIKRLFIFDYE